MQDSLDPPPGVIIKRNPPIGFPISVRTYAPPEAPFLQDEYSVNDNFDTFIALVLIELQTVGACFVFYSLCIALRFTTILLDRVPRGAHWKDKTDRETLRLMVSWSLGSWQDKVKVI